MAPPQHAVRDGDPLGAQAGESIGDDVADGRPNAPGVVGAHDAQALDDEAADADEQQGGQDDVVARLGLELLADQAPHDERDHGDDEGEACEVDDECHEVEVEVTVEEDDAEVCLNGGEDRGEEHDDESHVHEDVHNAAALFEQRAIENRLEKGRLEALAGVIGAVFRRADLPQAVLAHEEVHGHGQGDQEARVHDPA